MRLLLRGRVVDDRFRLLVSAVSSSPHTAYRFVDANPMRCGAATLDAPYATRVHVATHAAASDAVASSRPDSLYTAALASLPSRDDELDAAVKSAPTVHATDLASRCRPCS